MQEASVALPAKDPPAAKEKERKWPQFNSMEPSLGPLGPLSPLCVRQLVVIAATCIVPYGLLSSISLCLVTAGSVSPRQADFSYQMMHDPYNALVYRRVEGKA